MEVAARLGRGREPPGRVGRLTRRSFRYSASQFLCQLWAGSGFDVDDEAKNFRPEDRLLGTFAALGRWEASSRESVEVIAPPVLPCSSRCLDLCSKLIVGFSTGSRTKALRVGGNNAQWDEQTTAQGV